METKHTPTPWTLKISGGPTATVIDANGEMVLPLGEIECGWTDTSTGSYVDPEPEVMVMERIVKCVNACEGIADPSVVPELLELLGIAQATLTNIYAGHLAPVGYCSEAERQKALQFWPNSSHGKRIAAVIAKATGKTL